MSFREEFSAWRKENGYSQEEAARLLSVSVGTISKWERGLHEPDSDRVVGALSEMGIVYERPMVDRLSERISRAESRIDSLMNKVRSLEIDMYGAERTGGPLVDEEPPVIPASGIDRLGKEVEELRRRVDALDETAPGEDDPPSDEDQPQSDQAG